MTQLLIEKDQRWTDRRLRIVMVGGLLGPVGGGTA
jgi:hypothetical protein